MKFLTCLLAVTGVVAVSGCAARAPVHEPRAMVVSDAILLELPEPGHVLLVHMRPGSSVRVVHPPPAFTSTSEALPAGGYRIDLTDLVPAPFSVAPLQPCEPFRPYAAHPVRFLEWQEVGLPAASGATPEALYHVLVLVAADPWDVAATDARLAAMLPPAAREPCGIDPADLERAIATARGNATDRPWAGYVALTPSSGAGRR